MAGTKWGKKLLGGLEGVVPNCSKFCFSGGAEGEGRATLITEDNGHNK